MDIRGHNGSITIGSRGLTSGVSYRDPSAPHLKAALVFAYACLDPASQAASAELNQRRRCGCPSCEAGGFVVSRHLY